ncbi:gustatory receptor 10a [Scaptodrosophila lebanonensis]|uniref:Gustatory receptor n=1 Tax=Drosophila lebanonensis TaxID=7225 RepID=A0A6J2U048_DROLE|nr:gustatory receptor 10a [Scaptodrosophila lebanonensis]
MPAPALSFWQRHELKFYRYGHIYASIYGQAVIDYVPQRPMRPILKKLSIVYGHVLSLLLILVLPCYFGYHYQELTKTRDHRMQLLLYVSFSNTLIKLATVIVTYIANTVHFKAINHRCTLLRQRLEALFARSLCRSSRNRRRFEFFMYFKFCLINLMMIIQACGICALRGESWLRMLFAIYGFVLWNYTENMADYFYWISHSVLKYHRQLNVQLRTVSRQFRKLGALPRGGMLPHHCCRLCDRLALLRERFIEINALHEESLEMHQFQLLGLMLTTLINNLTNLFTLFNMLSKQSLEEISYPVLIYILYALGFYIDTYIVTLVNENIKEEMEHIALTVRRFTEQATLDVRLDQEIEHFSLQLLQWRQPYLCGLLHLDRRLVYLINVTAFSYFITLVQFDLYLGSANKV